jgi:hypothetical protein
VQLQNCEDLLEKAKVELEEETDYYGRLERNSPEDDDEPEVWHYEEKPPWERREETGEEEMLPQSPIQDAEGNEKEEGEEKLQPQTPNEEADDNKSQADSAMEID